MVDMDQLINNLEVQLNSEGGSMQVFKQGTGSVRNRDPPEIEDRSNMTSPPLLDANPMENQALFNDIKIEPPEELLASDFSLPQVEPVDLSFHKPKAPLQPASMLQAPICPPKPHSAPQTLVVSTSTSDMSTAANIPTVLTPGSVLTSQSSGGQQILHVIHTIPSVSLPNKMGGLKTIPVVVQSLPMVYTTLPADGGPAAITVPLIGGDGKNAGSDILRLRRKRGLIRLTVPHGWGDLRIMAGERPFLHGGGKRKMRKKEKQKPLINLSNPMRRIPYHKNSRGKTGPMIQLPPPGSFPQHMGYNSS
ncbi:Krueppel-like factor 8 isoform X2 [Sapajus apella]|uniref:Krueppel-like factor 8 isoform X2 n=1 Tax=Sapajus apella TaxID=9515 RepID=A0A6J3GWV9_SAPAP|nr:Krueppel-like factor 8 isoform X2 [Sapajus apella]